MDKKTKVTASDLMASLRNNSDYLIQQDRNEAKRRELEKRIQAEQKELIRDMAEKGFVISSVWDLVNSGNTYEKGIPILVKHLAMPYSSKVKEGIVRALAVKEAKGKANMSLIHLYHNLPKSEYSLRWAIGNTISVLVTKNDIESILTIVSNRDNGSSRQMFIKALTKFSSDKVVDVLLSILFDEDVTLQVLSALEKLKVKKAVDLIKTLLSDKSTNIRKAAEKAIRNIE